MLLREGVEARDVRVLDVDEEHRGRLVGQRRDELAAQIAVDLQQRDQQREPEAEREHDARRQRARPMDIGEHEPQQGKARARHAARDRHDEQRDEPEREEHRRRGADEDRGDLAVVGEQHRESCERRDDRHGEHDVAWRGMRRSGATASR